jgi:hypothetical protein
MVSQGHSSTRFSWRGDRLCHDNRLTGIELIPDSKYPGMWRIKYKDTISDMVNRARAKDAAPTIFRQRAE